jgi:hypothetical protein
MGRTVPSFRIVLGEEKAEWKPFRNALNKSEKKAFDEMWDIPKLYVMVCSSYCHLVPLHPIIMSILFHHYKELKQCIKEVEQMEATTAMTQKKLQIGLKEEDGEEGKLILDSYFINNNKIAES